MSKPENIEQGAKEIAKLLDEGKIGAVEERLRSDLYQMSPDELTQLVRKTSGFEKKGVGHDLELTDGKITLSHYDNDFWKMLGMPTKEVFSSDMGGFWSDPGFKSGGTRYVVVGAGFRDSAERRDREQNAGRFIEQQK